jgi:zinc protease
MKRTLILIILSFLLTEINVKAQAPINLSDLIPLDPNVQTGVLENGMTYYVMQNKKPEHRVVLRLVVNVGSTQENDDQQGLAHFTEHMAFNGTKNFEKNDIYKYIESIGGKLGADLNAYTGFDETVYKLLVPTDSAEIIDKSFLILKTGCTISLKIH